MRTLLAVVLLITLSSCGLPVRDERVVARYRLWAADTDEETCLMWDVGHAGDLEEKMGFSEGGDCLVPETVFAAGFNGQYVVAKSHPSRKQGPVSYFYIVRDPRNENNPDGEFSLKVNGPLTKDQWANVKARLHLPEFTIVLDDSE
jgi:hypothetical protein